MLLPSEIASAPFKVGADVIAALELLRDQYGPAGAVDSREDNSSRQPVRIVFFAQGRAQIGVPLNKRRLSIYMRNETLDGRKLTDLLPASMVTKVYAPGERPSRSILESDFLSPTSGAECLRLAPPVSGLRQVFDAFFGTRAVSPAPVPVPGSMRIRHARVQHAVGQGSFHTANVQLHTGGGQRYRYDYVYDCGGLRGRHPTPELMSSISNLQLEKRRASTAQRVINLMVLSHYDMDHINGAALITRMFAVGRVIVPRIGPKELMLVLASQADELSTDVVQQLHALANGSGLLFGRPVTEVLPAAGAADDGGDRPPNPAARPVDMPDRLTPLTDEADDDIAVNLPPPGDLVDAVEGAQPSASLGTSLDSRIAVVVHRPGAGTSAPPVWRLKFWNRGVDVRLLAHLEQKLRLCGFPLTALYARQGHGQLTEWLADKGNRVATLEAYRRAIELHKPTWAGEAQGRLLANFLSLGMYAGPASAAPRCLHHGDHHVSRPFPELQNRWPGGVLPLPTDTQRFGWLGTGDAPLGEIDTWRDFSTHYSQELGTTRTVQVPHHGAAPTHGPRFFHRGLVAEPGVRAVISAGMSNRYGHPRLVVVNEALAAGAQLEIVTDTSEVGYCECFEFEA